MIFTDAGLGDFLRADVNWVSDNWRLYLVDSTAFTPTTNPFVSELSGGAIIGYGDIPSRAVYGRTATCGVVSIITPPSGRTVAGMWVVHWTGTSSTSRLTAFTDRNSDLTPMSFVTDGSNVAVQFTPYVLAI